MAKKSIGKRIGDTPRRPSQPKVRSPGPFIDTKAAKVDPNKNQFEPTEEYPTPQRYNMAGGNC